MRAGALLRGLVFIATLVAAGFLLEVTQFGTALNEAWIDSQIRGHGLSGELLFIAVAGVATGLALPRQIISFLGGYAFGFLQGTLLALLGTVLGSVLAFFYARLVGRSFVVRRFGPRIKRLDDFLALHPFAMSLLIRLLPVGNNLLTSLAAGVTGVAALPFLLGSAVGYLPQTLVFALIGSGVNVDPTLRIGLGVVLFVLSSVLGVWLYRTYRHGKTLGDDVDAELEAQPDSGKRMEP
jgi:uncharacterized membrane protein YdjX (TVP38/TMEM64 family)